MIPTTKLPLNLLIQDDILTFCSFTPFTYQILTKMTWQSNRENPLQPRKKITIQILKFSMI